LVKAPPASEVTAQLARTLEAGLPENQQALIAGKMEPPQPPDAATLARLEERLPDFLRALAEPGNLERGSELFRQHCSACHVAKGIGTAVGPALDSEFQRAGETIVRDILFPHETITAGFEACQLEMRRGDDIVGLRVTESPTSVTLRFVGGSEATVLRKRLERVRLHKVSLMPAQFGELLTPRDVGDIVGFLRQLQP
jgi:putative heme-binding domain-containing protein